MTPTVNKIKKSILALLKENQVGKAGVFGSYARGQEKPTSDIDLLIEFTTKKSYIDFIELKQLLEKKLGKRVDLVTPKALHPRLRRAIDKDLVPLL